MLYPYKELAMNTIGPLSALAAARKVLVTAGKPLHYQEITRRILAAGLWRTAGKTPEATINAQLSTSIKKLGDASPFRHTGPGLFTLASGTKKPASPTRPAISATTSTKSTPRPASTRALVLGYIERISSDAFSAYPRQLTDLVQGRHGVYALYKGDHLYYVGLATNLRNRIKQHLNDRHAGKWNRFSLYLVRKAEHIRELESLILRISDPDGNATRGTLPGADNLRGALERSILAEQAHQNQSIFGFTKPPKARSRKPTRQRPMPTSRISRMPALVPFMAKGLATLRARHKGKALSARVNPDGTIHFKGRTFTSPSLAGAAAVNRKTCNGWNFWEYEATPDHWVKLDTLRK